MTSAVIEPARTNSVEARKSHRVATSLTSALRDSLSQWTIITGIVLLGAGGIALFRDWWDSRIPIAVELSSALNHSESAEIQELILTLTNTGNDPITIVGFEERLCGENFCFQITPLAAGQSTLQPDEKIELGALAHRRTKDKGAFTGLGAILYVNYRGELRQMHIPVTVRWDQ